jgi:hypothetical protein
MVLYLEKSLRVESLMVETKWLSECRRDGDPRLTYEPLRNMPKMKYLGVKHEDELDST